LDDTSAMQPLVDVAVSSRATQLSVDGIVTEAAKIQDILDDTSAMQPLVDVAVSSRASQLSVDGIVTEAAKIQDILDDTSAMQPLVDVAVSSRATQLSVDGIVTEAAKIQDILDDTSAMQPLVDVAVSSRATQLSVDGIVTEAAKIQDILDDTSAMQPLVDVAVSSRATQLSVDGIVTEAAKIQDILDDTSAMQPQVATIEGLVTTNLDASITAVLAAINDVDNTIAGLSGGAIRLVKRYERVSVDATIDIVALSDPGQTVTATLLQWEDPDGPGPLGDFSPVAGYDPIALTESATLVGGYYAPVTLAVPDGEYTLRVQYTDAGSGDTFTDSMTFTVTAVAGDLTALAVDVKDILDSVGDLSVSGSTLQAQLVAVKGTIDTNLDATVSSRASQLSVDGLVTEAAKIQDILDDTSAMQPLVDVAVSSRATQLSVDGLVTEAAKIQDILDDTSAMQPLVDVAVSSRASQLSVDGLVTEAAKIQDILDDTSAMQPLVDVAVSSRATQLSVDGIVTEAAKIQDILDDTDAMVGPVTTNLDVLVSSRASQGSVDDLAGKIDITDTIADRIIASLGDVGANGTVQAQLAGFNISGLATKADLIPLAKDATVAKTTDLITVNNTLAALQTDVTALSGVLDQVEQNVRDLLPQGAATFNILERYKTAATGKTIAIRARRIAGQGPLGISVFDKDNNLLTIPTNNPDNPDQTGTIVFMKAVPDEDVIDDTELTDEEKATRDFLTDGVAEYLLTLDSDWGLGDFTVVVTDLVEDRRDSFVLTVTETDVDAVGENAEEAATKAKRAKTQATTSALNSTEVRKWLASDDDILNKPGEIRELLEGLREKMEMIQGNIGTIPVEVGKELKPINEEMVKRMQALENVALLLVDAADPAALNTALKQIAESRKLVAELRELIEKSINSPVVEANWSDDDQAVVPPPEGAEDTPVD
ncbi:MAG: hypothetical protein RRC34_14860, partial [Lentisphaeria bacterium]|nr:hypothetical protein [Lentisphaeria bacterium]